MSHLLLILLALALVVAVLIAVPVVLLIVFVADWLGFSPPTVWEKKRGYPASDSP